MVLDPAIPSGSGCTEPDLPTARSSGTAPDSGGSGLQDRRVDDVGGDASEEEAEERFDAWLVPRVRSKPHDPAPAGPSRAVLERRLRAAEAQAEQLRTQLAQHAEDLGD
ncbi:hypothetical protein [Streptomyces sp. NPDC086989]|uniref:hypothetical protein n=1 Tax=Streptomyces sp. NPDC086989 TaxID=3365764 RepID=UPI00382CF111